MNVYNTRFDDCSCLHTVSYESVDVVFAEATDTVLRFQSCLAETLFTIISLNAH